MMTELSNAWATELTHLLQSSSLWLFILFITLMPLLLFIFLPQSPLRQYLIRSLFWFLGLLFLLLGISGIVLPVVPTTPFILLTAACWAKASPRFHQWLYHHPYFGKMVQNWEEKRAVPFRAKILAFSMMGLSCAMLFWRFPQQWWIGLITSLICLATAIFLWRLPNA